METTRLSNEGQVSIPKALRDAHHWEAGQELIAIDTGDGILLKLKNLLRETTLEDIAGCLNYVGALKSLKEIEDASWQGVVEQWQDYG